MFLFSSLVEKIVLKRLALTFKGDFFGFKKSHKHRLDHRGREEVREVYILSQNETLVG